MEDPTFALRAREVQEMEEFDWWKDGYSCQPARMRDTDVSSPTDAAGVVFRERSRERDANTYFLSLPYVEQPQLETVSLFNHEPLDESELDRRHREVAQKLEQKQLEVQRQSQPLGQVRKQKFWNCDRASKVVNKKENVLVIAVNHLSKELHAKESELHDLRQEKQNLSFGLIKVMAKNQKRKIERLNELAELVGAERIEASRNGSGFAGF